MNNFIYELEFEKKKLVIRGSWMFVYTYINWNKNDNILVIWYLRREIYMRMWKCYLYIETERKLSDGGGIFWWLVDCHVSQILLTVHPTSIIHIFVLNDNVCIFRMPLSVMKPEIQSQINPRKEDKESR